MMNNLNFESYSENDPIPEPIKNEATGVYIAGFAMPPYNEKFTVEEARDAFQFILDRPNGSVVIGKEDNRVVSMAGGYSQADGTFFIEELVVLPENQGRKVGRATLRALFDQAELVCPTAFELRTNEDNERAKSLYLSEGFNIREKKVIVPSRRQNGKIGLDQRIYMRKELNGEQAKEKLERVAVMYPSGNTTAVVFDQLLQGDRQQLNDQVMNAWKDRFAGESEIEQCCFVTEPADKRAVARVEMFGGEFCGNATRSVVELLTADVDEDEGLIEVSGAQDLLQFSKSQGMVTVEIPSVEESRLDTVREGVIVNIDGISQLVVTEPSIQDRESARAMLQRMLSANNYGLADRPAVGISYYDRTSGKADFAVWVKNVDTIFDETACGSGTAAIAMSELQQGGGIQSTCDVIQPSGATITASCQRDNSGGKSSLRTFISGKTAKLYDGGLELA